MIGILYVQPVLHTQGTSQYIICPILFCFLWHWQFSCMIWFSVSAGTFLVLHMVVGVFIWCCFLVFFYYLRNQYRWITISSILCCGKLKYMYWKSCTCKSLCNEIRYFFNEKKCLVLFLFYEQMRREILSKVNLCPMLYSTNSLMVVV